MGGGEKGRRGGRGEGKAKGEWGRKERVGGVEGEESGRCSSQRDAKLQVLQMSEEGGAGLISVSCILKPSVFFSVSFELI